MILSYHPCFEADKNLLCAGRNPGPDDLDAIKTADAVILPQGCYPSLYKIVRDNCKHVFPNFDTRFKYQGKIGQIRLFQEINVAHPKTETYLNVDAFYRHTGDLSTTPDFYFPFVLKFDWGEEGKQVYLIKSSQELQQVLEIAVEFEKSGQKGFVIQEYIPSKNRSLRVVVIGQTVISYWLIQRRSDNFISNLAKGSIIDNESNPGMQRTAVQTVKDFCGRTGINLAGFDILFPSDKAVKSPLFLEINHYFGRRGLGGSKKFYTILNKEILKWIEHLGLPFNPQNRYNGTI